MEGTYPHCLCVRSVLARIRPLYTYIDISYTHTRAHTSFTRVYLSWRVVAFILVAVSSDGRLFNAIIRRSIVSQPFFFHPLLPPPSCSFDLLHPWSRSPLFLLGRIDSRCIHLGSDRSLRNEKRSASGGGGGIRLTALLSLSLEREAILLSPFPEFTSLGHRLTVKKG